MLYTIKCLNKKHPTTKRYNTRTRYAQKIYYCSNLCFKIEGLNEPELLSSFENFYQSLKTNYFFWSYNSNQHIISADETTKFAYDDIVLQLNILVSWLSSKKCHIVGSFTYHTDKYTGLIYIPFGTNIVNHIVMPANREQYAFQDLDTMIQNTNKQIRLFAENIGITDIPIFYM